MLTCAIPMTVCHHTFLQTGYVRDIDDSPTAFLVNSRTLIGFADLTLEALDGESAHRIKLPLDSVVSYLLYADVRVAHSDDSS